MGLPIDLFNDKNRRNEVTNSRPEYEEIPDLDMYGGQYAPLQNVPSQDQSFLKWIFDFRAKTITPLKHIWRGEEIDENERWVKSENRLMNERGVSWGISFIESFLSPVYVTSNYTEDLFNYNMQEVVRSVYWNLCLRYREFDLKKSDIDRVAIEIESKVQAILLGARGDGYRKFFSSTTHHNENITQMNQGEQKRGFLNRIGFK